MSDYTNAPGTKLLATRCAVCSRPLLDAVSVERGIGPDCWKRYGTHVDPTRPAQWEAVMAALDGIEAVADVNPTLTPRDAANKLVYRIAIEQDGFAVLMRAEAIRLLGFDRLAWRIIERASDIRVVEGTTDKNDPCLYVTAPYNELSYTSWRALGAYWRKGEKRWCITVTSIGGMAAKRKGLWDLLKRFYSGKLGFGEHGPFVVRSAVSVAA